MSDIQPEAENRWNELVARMKALDYRGEESKRQQFRELTFAMRDVAEEIGLDFKHWLVTGEGKFIGTEH